MASYMWPSPVYVPSQTLLYTFLQQLTKATWNASPTLRTLSSKKFYIDCLVWHFDAMLNVLSVLLAMHFWPRIFIYCCTYIIRVVLFQLLFIYLLAYGMPMASLIPIIWQYWRVNSATSTVYKNQIILYEQWTMTWCALSLLIYSSAMKPITYHVFQL